MIFSVSRLKLFEACRMAYRFRYIEKLEPVNKADALQLGSNYHELLEKLYADGNLDGAEGYSRELAMAKAYEKYIYPKFGVKAVEEWFEYDLGRHTLIGRVDGVATDNHLVEHKTTGETDLEKYEFELQWDEQILAYMLGYGVRKMWYTIVRKPNIRQKANETDEEFFERMVEWFDTDTYNKIRLVEIVRTDDEVEEFKRHIIAVADMMEEAEKNSKDCIYRNTMHCNCWGKRCEFSSICLDYDPEEQYIEFMKREEG